MSIIASSVKTSSIGYSTRDAWLSSGLAFQNMILFAKDRVLYYSKTSITSCTNVLIEEQHDSGLIQTNVLCLYGDISLKSSAGSESQNQKCSKKCVLA